MIYGAHAERRGLLFAFTFGNLTDCEYETLISVGFDDAFELQREESRKFLRIYSWIRRFGGTPVSDRDVEREAIARLSQKSDKQFGKWTIVVNERVARDGAGHVVSLLARRSILSHRFSPSRVQFEMHCMTKTSKRRTQSFTN